MPLYVLHVSYYILFIVLFILFFTQSICMLLLLNCDKKMYFDFDFDFIFNLLYYLFFLLFHLYLISG